MQPSPGTGHVVRTTGAAVGRDPRAANEPELSLDEAATRLAGQLCAREVVCHHDDPSIAGSCVSQYLRRTRAELSRWQCSPEASRARTKACLASIRSEPCELDLAKRPTVCGPNVDCPGAGP